jgi:hypothetical protein
VQLFRTPGKTEGLRHGNEIAHLTKLHGNLIK